METISFLANKCFVFLPGLIAVAGRCVHASYLGSLRLHPFVSVREGLAQGTRWPFQSPLQRLALTQAHHPAHPCHLGAHYLSLLEELPEAVSG